MRLKHRLILFFVLAGIAFFCPQPAQIQGSSMEPALSDGEWVWTIPLLWSPSEGDCVIFTSPYSGKISVKRVMAAPGDGFVTAHQSIGRPSAPLFIHNIVRLSRMGLASAPAGAFLEKDFFYLLGDNEMESLDSRFYGPVSKKNIRRKVIGFGKEVFSGTNGV